MPGHLDLTLPTPAGNLACDEARLRACDQGGAEVLRFWEPTDPFVVVGYANRVATEVRLDVCAHLGIPVLRRTSGGGTVVQMPGCLNYALVLRPESDPWRTGIGASNRHIPERLAAAFEPLVGAPVRPRGETDLVLGVRKFAGNAQRRLQRAFLFHGCILLRADLGWIERLLPMPSREPAYRAGRPHREFVVNLEIPVPAVKAAIRAAWGAESPLESWPRTEIQSLLREKYEDPRWNQKF